ncbi:Rieske 2Fe-2S domain-containing protein [Pseudomonas bohemica]|uniref:Rieske 2Fe-2S domain-containing protein n=1 Tax=Pseudomonas bohemica TaxID=2044872 RepID=UPI000DA60892|nr:aromatic ring-hydroxylating dioxygenase subunit alpha [Pseudomonas bohemica]
MSASEIVQDPAFNQWFVLAMSSDLRPHQARGYELLNTRVVLWRGTTEVRAWHDQCPHRGAALSLGKVHNEALSCPYHGWAFEGNGRCSRYPAHPDRQPPPRAHARTFQCIEQDGCLWVSLGKPSHAPPRFMEIDQAEYRSTLVGEWNIKANAYRVMENFLDMAHFNFVHPTTLGAGADSSIAAYQVEAYEHGFIARDCRVVQLRGNLSADAPAQVLYDYEVLGLTVAALHKKTDNCSQASDVIRLLVVPVDAHNSVIRMLVSYDYAGIDGIDDLAVIAFNRSILLEDVPILESQRPKELPLYTAVELSQPSDSSAIEYRRYLKRLGIKFGTC